MNATVVDIRYKMNEILKALDRRESVKILYHGKLKGTIEPVAAGSASDLAKHPFFGSAKNDGRKVADIMMELRGGRYRAL